MALSLNKPKLDNLAGDIRKSAERLRNKFKAYEYQNVILPIIVIRRLECMRQAKVYLGNSLIPHDPHSREPGDQLPEPKNTFDFMLSNPPFGVTWGGKDGYEAEARKLEKTRYRAGMPRVNDGALLFLETMLAKMKAAAKEGKNGGGSRIAIIFNGSPLSNGDCGSGESEIRRWILENNRMDPPPLREGR